MSRYTCSVTSLNPSDFLLGFLRQNIPTWVHCRYLWARAVLTSSLRRHLVLFDIHATDLQYGWIFIISALNISLGGSEFDADIPKAFWLQTANKLYRLNNSVTDSWMSTNIYMGSMGACRLNYLNTAESFPFLYSSLNSFYTLSIDFTQSDPPDAQMWQPSTKGSVTVAWNSAGEDRMAPLNSLGNLALIHKATVADLLLALMTHLLFLVTPKYSQSWMRSTAVPMSSTICSMVRYYRFSRVQESGPKGMESPKYLVSMIIRMAPISVAYLLKQQDWSVRSAGEIEKYSKTGGSAQSLTYWLSTSTLWNQVLSSASQSGLK